MRFPTRPILLLTVAFSAACQLEKSAEPSKPVIHYNLSEYTRGIDEKSGELRVPLEVQPNIAGSLEMLFGDATQPQFLLLDAWKDEGFDLNWPTYAKGESGSGEFDADELAELWKDNERAFRAQLASIDAGDFAAVTVPSWMPSLAEAWGEFLAGDEKERTQENARKLFVEFYPRLRDSSELYRQHCLHCHGPEGGGDGPTARFLNPRPRDYRLGTFKFTAVGKSVPRRADLFRILDEGVTGTAMPSFRRFAKAQMHGLVDYVRLLSMRGMVERDLVNTVAEEGVLTLGNVLGSYEAVWDKWAKANEKVLAFDGPVPAPTPESIAHGRELFMDAKAGNCFSCHGPEGRGDGTSAFAADPATGEIKPTYKDDWGNEILPRNLRVGVFRGGRRPIDLYRRIKNGIAGTPMPEAASTLTSDDIWSLVHYVGSLSERPLHVAPAAAPHGASDPHGEPAKH